MNIILLLTTAILPSTLCITNDPSRRDSYMSAYLDLQVSTEPPAGVVYAEPIRTYGPPQPRPLVYYGPPAPTLHGSPASIPIDHHTYAQDYAYAPVIDILMKLPEKLDFLPKLIAGFLGITKILLKVVLLKMILKFIVMFCLFFFLPKLGMLDMATDGEAANTSPTSPSAGPHTPVEELEEGRLNSITNFVLDSVESRHFLDRYCDLKESTFKCKLVKTLVKLKEYATVPRIVKLLKTSNSNEVEH